MADFIGGYDPSVYAPVTPTIDPRRVALLQQARELINTPVNQRPPQDIYAPTPSGKSDNSGNNTVNLQGGGTAVLPQAASEGPMTGLYKMEMARGLTPDKPTVWQSVLDFAKGFAHDPNAAQERQQRQANQRNMYLSQLHGAAQEEEMAPYRQAQASELSALAENMRRTGATGRAGVQTRVVLGADGQPMLINTNTGEPLGQVAPGYNVYGTQTRQAAPPNVFRPMAGGGIMNSATGELVRPPAARQAPAGRSAPASKVDPNTGMTQQQANIDAQTRKEMLQATMAAQSGDPTQQQAATEQMRRIVSARKSAKLPGMAAGAAPAPAQETAPKPQSTGGSKIIYDPQGKPYHVVNGQWVPLK
jgi:hypothetical protein